jgi:hypothetical protein
MISPERGFPTNPTDPIGRLLPIKAVRAFLPVRKGVVMTVDESPDILRGSTRSSRAAQAGSIASVAAIVVFGYLAVCLTLLW